MRFLSKLAYLLGPMAVVYAQGTLTGTPADTETVTVGGKVYTFQDTLTNTDGNVHVGATAAESMLNLKAAINLEAGAGTAYAAATTVNANVAAVSTGATTCVVRSKVPGAIGNLIASTETGSSLAWGAATLASGSGSIYTEIQNLIDTKPMSADVKQALRDLSDPAGTQ